MQFLVRPGSRVLDLGCGTGNLLAALKPNIGVGVDLSARMVEVARSKFPHLDFRCGDIEDPEFMSTLQGPFDYIILSDTIGLLDDVETALGHLHAFSTPHTRLVISYYSQLWEPLLKVAAAIGARMPQPPINLLSDSDFINILDLADFESIRYEVRQLVPKRLLGLGTFINRFVAPLPLVNRLCLRTYVVARSRRSIQLEELAATVVIPCRNERGNIEAAVQRLPEFGRRLEILFVEGNSTDATYEECLRIKEAYSDIRNIRVLKQPGRGKADAVRKGFEEAAGDVLIILDADLTVPPEAVPKFYAAIASGKGEFVNGTRLVYPMEKGSMQALNLVANRLFAYVFSYLINQRFTDTLCGTKALRKSSYETIAENRSYFGNFDPFGDFDLILGASKQSFKILEIPIHYAARTHGATQISRFRDGFKLVRMVLFAYRKLKAL
jgi:SAM-dependent methyltransferase